MVLAAFLQMKLFQSRFTKFTVVLFLILLSLGSVFSDEAIDWIGSHSSKELEGGESDSGGGAKKIYYYWQIQSLKRAVSPRYIRIMDISNYVSTNNFLNKGILFTYNGLKNTDISLCGNFSSWRCIPMQRNRYGIYYTVIPANYQSRNEEDFTSYDYKFQVDGIFVHDPENKSKAEDGEGSFYSIYNLESTDFEKNVSARVIDSEIHDDLDFKTVEFRIYKPEANTIALIGSFNQWNPEHDYLVKQRNGLFVLRKKLKSGDYLYYYQVDGEAMVDTYNPETRFRPETEELCSYLKVPDSHKSVMAGKE